MDTKFHKQLGFERFPSTSTNESFVETPKHEEMRSTIKMLKNNKAKCCDDMQQICSRAVEKILPSQNHVTDDNFDAGSSARQVEMEHYLQKRGQAML